MSVSTGSEVDGSVEVGEAEEEEEEEEAASEMLSPSGRVSL